METALEARESEARPRVGYARSRETRARILAAALAEAGEVGFHKTSVARIAARAGVAVGNLNYHFGSKSDLLRELMVTLVKDLQSRIHIALPDDSDDFFDQERAGLLTYLTYLRENPAYGRLVDEVRLHEPELYRVAVSSWVEQFQARVQSAIGRKVMRPMDDFEIRAHGYFLFGIHQFLDTLLEGEPGNEDERIVDAYLALIRSGLGGAVDGSGTAQQGSVHGGSRGDRRQ